MWRHVLAICLLIALATEAVVVRLNVTLMRFKRWSARAMGRGGCRRHDRSRYTVADQPFAPAVVMKGLVEPPDT